MGQVVRLVMLSPIDAALLLPELLSALLSALLSPIDAALLLHLLMQLCCFTY